jgi:hypothetical protein
MRRGHPKTEAATYVNFALRLPPDVMSVIRARAEESGAAINVELVRAVQRGLGLPTKTYPAPPPLPSREAPGPVETHDILPDGGLVEEAHRAVMRFPRGGTAVLPGSKVPAQ